MTTTPRLRTTTIHRTRQRPPVPHADAAASIDPHTWAAILGIELPGRVRLPATDRNVLGLPAAWAAVNRIANAVAQMLASADVMAGRAVVAPRPQIVDRPNINYGRFVFWKELVATALMRGNWVGILTDPDDNGWPQTVVPVPIDMVSAEVRADGRVVYEIAGESFVPDQLAHVRLGITMPGQPMAIGVIEAHRRGLAGQLAQQTMTRDLYDNGAVPTGVVQLDVAEPTDGQVRAVKHAWIGALGGKRTVAVTGNRMTYTPVPQWSAEDAQWIEAQQFSVSQAALMFGLRPEDLGASMATRGGQTYANRTDDSLQRITDSYVPVLQPIEETWSDLLPDGQEVKGNVEVLLRSSTMERFETYQAGLAVGVYADAGEVREIEGRPPRPGHDGDTEITTESEEPDDA